MLRKIAWGLVLLAIVVFNAARFWKLDAVPYGYHVDELASAVTVQCMAERGRDADLRPWPLFGAVNFGQDKPPTYIYPAMLWAKVFGPSVPSLRAFGGTVFLMGVLGLFLLGRHIAGPSLGLAVALAGTCSPWSWVANRLALESNFSPVFGIWALYLFWRSNRALDWAAAGLFFALAMYAYPPARLQIPLTLAALAVYEWRRRPFRWASLAGMAAVFIVSLLPMAVMYLHGGLSRRFDQIGIFNKDYLYVLGGTSRPWDIFSAFVHNYLLHLSPDFLFGRGDHSYLYSTRHSGIFGWLDTGALIIFAGFFLAGMARRSWRNNPLREHRRWLLFLAAHFLIGIIPSALTNQGLPHALRINGSWPSMMLFTGFMWWSAAQTLQVFWPVMALGGILGGGALLFPYFTLYPQESRAEFGSWARDLVGQLRTPQDWKEFVRHFRTQPYHCRYFLSQRLGMDCLQAKEACR